MLDTSFNSIAIFLLRICSLSTHGDYALTVSITRGSDYIMYYITIVWSLCDCVTSD